MNIVSAIASSSTFERSQGIKQLKEALKTNLAKFLRYTVEARIGKTFWVSNEFSGEMSTHGRLNLPGSYAKLPSSKPLSGYCVAVITGEGGVLQGLPELAACCDLILQVDCDPKPLQFCALLLEEFKNAKQHTDMTWVLENALAKLKKVYPDIGDEEADEIYAQFQDYCWGMRRNLFSSAERFAEFKACQDHPIEQLCMNYFSKEAMAALSQTLKDHDASVRFLNLSNVLQYPISFYENHPYDGTIAKMTPARYVLELPFFKDAICAYSMFFGCQLFTATTATATVAEMPDALHSCTIIRRNWDLEYLARTKGDTVLYKQLLGKLNPAAVPARKLATRIFMFFAKYSIEEEHEWILRVTAARITPAEVQELKTYKQLIKTTYLLRTMNFQHRVVNIPPPRFFEILDKITAEPAAAETSLAADSVTQAVA